MGIRDYNLGENKLEQQTPIPPPPPQIKDEATQKPKRAIFPSGGRRGGSKCSIYFVQDCSLLGRRSDSGERCEVKRTGTG